MKQAMWIVPIVVALAVLPVGVPVSATTIEYNSRHWQQFVSKARPLKLELDSGRILVSCPDKCVVLDQNNGAILECYSVADMSAACFPDSSEFVHIDGVCKDSRGTIWCVLKQSRRSALVSLRTELDAPVCMATADSTHSSTPLCIENKIYWCAQGQGLFSMDVVHGTKELYTQTEKHEFLSALKYDASQDLLYVVTDSSLQSFKRSDCAVSLGVPFSNARRQATESSHQTVVSYSVDDMKLVEGPIVVDDGVFFRIGPQTLYYVSKASDDMWSMPICSDFVDVEKFAPNGVLTIAGNGDLVSCFSSGRTEVVRTNAQLLELDGSSTNSVVLPFQGSVEVLDDRSIILGLRGNLFSITPSEDRLWLDSRRLINHFVANGRIFYYDIDGYMYRLK